MWTVFGALSLLRLSSSMCILIIVSQSRIVINFGALRTNLFCNIQRNLKLIDLICIQILVVVVINLLFLVMLLLLLIAIELYWLILELVWVKRRWCSRRHHIFIFFAFSLVIILWVLVHVIYLHLLVFLILIIVIIFFIVHIFLHFFIGVLQLSIVIYV